MYMTRSTDRTPPEGLLFYASGPIDGGWGIIDFWESRADFDAFAPRIVEGMAAAGIEPEGPPISRSSPCTRRSALMLRRRSCVANMRGRQPSPSCRLAELRVHSGLFVVAEFKRAVPL